MNNIDIENFEPKIWYDYNPIMEILNNNSYYVLDSKNTSIDSEEIVNHILKCEESNKIAIFYNLKFTEINVSHHKFTVPIFFISCHFEGILKLSDNSYLYPIIFHSVTFEEISKFKLSLFFNGLSFVNCVFKKEVLFERVKLLANNIKYKTIEFIKNKVNFLNIFNITNKVDLLGVVFFKDVSFMNSNIGCSVLFSNYKNINTVFHGDCNFSCNIEETESLFLDQTVQSSLNEIILKLDTIHHFCLFGVKFYGEVTFENRKFQKKTVFKEVIFYKAPKFHNSELHQDTDFHGSEFKDTHTNGAEKAYRTLKLMMDKKRARREQGMFFALEQKSLFNKPIKKYNNKIIDALRFKINNIIVNLVLKDQDNSSKLNDNNNLYINFEDHHSGFYLTLTDKIVSYLYLILSDYGQSIKKPLIGLIISSFLIFPIIYLFVLGNITNVYDIGISYHTSLQQLFRPFEIYSSRYGGNSMLGKVDLTFLFYTVATIQSMINIGLITLFILAIRCKFRVY